MPLVNKIKSLMKKKTQNRWKKLSIAHTVFILVHVILTHILLVKLCRLPRQWGTCPVPGMASSTGLQLTHPWARLSPPDRMAVPRGSVCRDGQNTAHEQLMRGKRCEKQPFEAQDGGGEEVFHVPGQSFLQSLESPHWSRETAKGRSGERISHGLILTTYSPAHAPVLVGEVEKLGMTECSWGWGKKSGEGKVFSFCFPPSKSTLAIYLGFWVFFQMASFFFLTIIGECPPYLYLGPWAFSPNFLPLFCWGRGVRATGRAHGSWPRSAHHMAMTNLKAGQKILLLINMILIKYFLGFL